VERLFCDGANELKFRLADQSYRVIKTIETAFEMRNSGTSLRDHIAGLNAGRWDYIFSIIKKFRQQRDFVLPDRAQITMTVPFMRAYTELLVKTCHQRGAHAIGGMAAFIPSRKDSEVNARALANVREDKVRESNDGFDGTWVAHPDLVAVAKEPFAKKLGNKPHQKTAARRVQVAPKICSTSACRQPNHRGWISQQHQCGYNIWSRGFWARRVGIFNLMEDAATAGFRVRRCGNAASSQRRARRWAKNHQDCTRILGG
jgi:malate synthase